MPLRLALVIALLAAETRGHSSGVDSCSEVPPGHGALGGSAGAQQTISLLYAGAAVTSYTPGAAHTLQLSGTLAWKGFAVAGFAGASFPGSFAAAKAGAVSAPFADARAMSSCAGGMTHPSATSVTSASGTWTAPSAGTGAVTFHAIFVQMKTGTHLTATLTVAEGALPSPLPSPPPPSASPTPSSSPTPSTSPTPSASPTGSLSASSTLTPSHSATPTPSWTLGVSPSGTPTISLTPSATPSISRTLTPSQSPTPSLALAPPVPAVFTQSLALGPGLTLQWRIARGRFFGRLSSSRGGWASVGVNTQPGMVGADAILVEPAAPGPSAAKISLVTLPSYNGVTRVTAASALATLDAASSNFSVHATGVGWTADFSRLLAAGAYAGALPLPAAGSAMLVAAWGAPTDG